MALFFFFDDNRLNLLVYFIISTLVLYLGPSFFVPSIKIDVPIVQTELGQLRGDSLISSLQKRPIFAYRGIPYALPPLDALRFSRPVPMKQKWQGIRDATKHGEKCVQAEDVMGFQRISGSEDCLYLNVYVPKTFSDTKKLLPVMVYIHGGGFTVGSGTEELHGPQNLLDRDIVLVTLNYRLGPIGFFTLKTDEVAGNQGLWDQIEALRWVQRHIESFGGDPDRVTIFGNSAGGFSVSALLVSHIVEKEKLVHGAIAQSGSLHMPFAALDNRGSVIDYHEQYARHLGCQSSDRKEVIKCLRALPAEKLVGDAHLFDSKCNFMPVKIPFINPWSPSHDHTFSSQPFFKDDRRQLIRSGRALDVPVMAGFTKDDGLITAATLHNRPSLYESWKNNWDDCSALLYLGDENGERDHSVEIELTRKTEEFYYGSKLELPPKSPLEEPFFEGYTRIMTDSQFAYGANTMVEGLLSNEKRKSPVFYYRLDHLASFSYSDIFGLNTVQQMGLIARKALGIHSNLRLGVSHVDENLHLFTLGFPMKVMTDARDQRMQRFMVDLWVNFATYGNPTPKSTPNDVLSEAWKAKATPNWPQVDKKNVRFARLEDSEIHVDLNDTDDKAYERIRFWKQILVPKLTYLQ